MRRTLRSVALALVAAVLLSEILLRIIPRSVVPGLRLLDRVYGARSAWTEMMEGDSYLGYKLKPDLDVQFPSEGRQIPFRTKSYGLGDIGFRDLGMAPPFQVLAVGASFTVCDDVPAEACWVRQLAQSLGVSGVTLAVNGYSTLAAERMFERYGEHFHPKLVLLEVHPNDFRDNASFARWAETGDGNLWNWLATLRGRTPWVRWLGQYSMLFRLIDGTSRGMNRPIFPYNQDGLDFVFRLDTWFLNVVRKGEKHEGWPLIEQSLLDLQKAVAKQGAELLVVLFPTKEQVYWDRVSAMAPVDISANVDRPVELVATFCRQQGIHCCDLRGPLRERARQPGQLFHRISAHPNDLGHAVSAAAVRECLREQGMIQELDTAGTGGNRNEH